MDLGSDLDKLSVAQLTERFRLLSDMRNNHQSLGISDSYCDEINAAMSRVSEKIAQMTGGGKKVKKPAAKKPAAKKPAAKKPAAKK